MSVRGEERILIEHLLREAPLFSASSEEFVAELACHLQTTRCSDAEPVLRKGHPCSCMILLAFGVANVVIDEEQVGELTAKQSIGDVNLLGIASDAQATLLPGEGCTFVAIERKDFCQVFEDFPEEKSHFNAIADKYRGSYLEGTLKCTSDFFRGLHEDTLHALNLSMENRLFFPEQHVLKEGDEGEYLCMLVQGQVSIEIAGRVVKRERRGYAADLRGAEIDDSEVMLASATTPVKEAETAPPCYGELGLLGVKKVRQASVIAESVCQIRILHRSVFLKLLEVGGDALQGELPLARYTDAADPSRLQLSNVPLFKELNCAEEFLDFLASHLEERVFMASQRMVIEDVPDDCAMYIIMEGTAIASKGADKVASMGRGDVFGERVLLGLATARATTVVAETTCFVKVLPRAVMIRGLELFPQERKKVLIMAFKREQVQERGKPQTPVVSFSLAQDAADADWKATELKVVMRAVKTSPFFAAIGSSFIEKLGSVSADRIYMPGDLIIAEGTEGDSMFIMISGSAAVYTSNAKTTTQGLGSTQRGSLVGRRRSRGLSYFNKDNKLLEQNCQKIGVLKAGSISGEMAMLGIAHARSATILAETICCMWEITHNAAMPIIEQFPDTRQHFAAIIVQNLQHTVPLRIDALPVFKQFERKFRLLLGLYCERGVFFPRQKIFIEGQRSEGLYIINQGKAQIAMGGLPLKTVSSGSYLNSTTMLGLRKWCFCSLTAARTCHVIVVSRSSYLQALERYPDKEVNRQITRSEEIAEADFRASTHRALTRTRVWRWIIAESGHFGGLRFGNPAKNQEKDTAVVQRCFEAWSRLSGQTRKRRAEHEDRMRVVDQWVEKRQQALAHRQQKDAERELPFKPVEWMKQSKAKGVQKAGQSADVSQSRQGDSTWMERDRSPSPTREREMVVHSIYSNWRHGLGVPTTGAGSGGGHLASKQQASPQATVNESVDSGPMLPALNYWDDSRMPGSQQDSSPCLQTPRTARGNAAHDSSVRRRRRHQPPWQDTGPLHGKDGAFGLPHVSPRETPRRTHSQPSPRSRPWSRPQPPQENQSPSTGNAAS